jgi:hypothetical protein
MLHRLHKLATARNVIILLILDLIMMLGVMPYLGRRMAAIVGSARPLDLALPTYSPAYVHEMMAAYGKEGRAFYRSILLGADLVYPIIYGFAFALLLAYIWPILATGSRWLRWLPVIPLLCMVCDFGENISIAGLIAEFPAQSDGLARLAGFFSLMKWIFAFITGGLVLTGLNGLLIRWLRSR